MEPDPLKGPTLSAFAKIAVSHVGMVDAERVLAALTIERNYELTSNETVGSPLVSLHPRMLSLLP